MEENLSILNVSFDNLVLKQEFKLPKLAREFKDMKFNKKYSKKPSKYKHQSLGTSLIQSQIPEKALFVGSSSYKYNIPSLGFTPKLKTIVKPLPFAEKIFGSPRSSLVPDKKTLKYKNLIDWKTSMLENCIISNITEFNSEEDPSMLSEYQIHNLEVIGSGYAVKDCIKATCKRMCQEMVLNDYYIDKITDNQLYETCKKLFSIRESTLQILKLIHEREQTLLRTATEEQTDENDLADHLKKLKFKITERINKWKMFKISNQKFIYSGQDYLTKLHTDLDFLKSSSINK
jgi:hypothetical protein